MLLLALALLLAPQAKRFPLVEITNIPTRPVRTEQAKRLPPTELTNDSIGAERAMSADMLQIPPADSAIRVGRGFNSLSGTAMSVCLTQAATDLPESGGGPTTHIEMTLLEDEQRFERTQKLNASARFGFGAYSGDASYGFLKEGKFHSYSQHLSLAATVQRAPQLLRTLTLTKSAANILNRSKEDPGFGDRFSDFVALCGDYAIIGRLSGGTFNAIASIETRDSSEKTIVEGALKAAVSGVSNGEVKVTMSDQLETFLKQGRTSVSLNRTGSSVALTGIDIASLPKSVAAFVGEVSGNDSSVLVAYLAAPWVTIMQEVIALDAGQVEKFNALGMLLNRIYRRRGSTAYMLGHQSEFSPFKREDALNELDILDSWAHQLLSDAATVAKQRTKKDFNTATCPEISKPAEWRKLLATHLPEPVQQVQWRPVNVTNEDWTFIGTTAPEGNATASTKGLITLSNISAERPDWVPLLANLVYKTVNRQTGVVNTIKAGTITPDIDADADVYARVLDAQGLYTDNSSTNAFVGLGTVYKPVSGDLPCKPIGTSTSMVMDKVKTP